jgi:tripartite-type tricarboxylate transporter receptor subunit TctC
MKLPRRKFLHVAAGIAALTALPRCASAQAYPSRPVHILVGLAAGGPTDTAARVMAEWLSQQFKQQFIVENRTGMGGNLANQAAFSSLPDGHTLLFTGPNTTISTALYKKLSYNLFEDSIAVGAMMRFPNIMVVPPDPSQSRLSRSSLITPNPILESCRWLPRALEPRHISWGSFSSS